MSPQHHRRTIRLQEYDYSQVGAYFITICAHNRECLFGTIADGEIILNEYGRVVQKCWLEIPGHFPHIELDEFIIMPNHVHGIVVITDHVGATHASPLHQMPKHRTPFPNGPKSKSLSAIIGSYKSAVTKRINQIRQMPSTSVWQQNYYERIFRNENELNQIREYITTNPLNWNIDENFIA